MKNSEKVICWVKGDLLRSTLPVALCLDPETYYDLMRAKGIRNPNLFVTPGANATTHYFEAKDGSGDELIVVCVGPWKEKDPIVIAGLLVHEAVHIFDRQLEMMGEKTPSHEFHAYGIQGISQNLMWAFVELTKNAL